MNQRYIVVGTFRVGDFVRVSLKREDVVKIKKNIDVMSMLSGDVENITNNISVDTILSQHPDVITISFKEWSKKEYKINDVVNLSIDGGEK